MNQYFPYSFSERPLRISCQVVWIHAISVYANGIRELREANLSGWFYARGGCRMGDDKAGFHAIGAIGGIDGKP